MSKEANNFRVFWALLSVMLLVSLPTLAAQYARPNGDRNNTVYWFDTPGQSVTHYTSIDEETPDGVAELVEDDTATLYWGTLSAVTDPENDGSGHTFRCAVYRSSNKANTFTMYLYQGTSTLIKQSTPVEVQNGTPAAYTYGTMALDAADANNITNYSDLYFALAVDATSPTDIFIDQCEFEVPDAPSSGRRRPMIIN